MLKSVRLDHLEPNPYRHFETYPILDHKIDALIESIGATGFWGETVIARKISQSEYQVAFGHHRIEAARRALGKKARVEISIRDLDDSQMLAMMARENNETYAITADMDIEIVRAAIEGFAEGYIELPAPGRSDGHGGSRRSLTVDAFGFESDDPSRSSFTREGLGELLGMPHRRVVAALRNLKLVNTDKVAEPKDYQGLKHDQAAELSRAVHKVKTKAGPEAAKRAAQRISEEIKQIGTPGSDSGRRPARTIAQRIQKEEIERVKGPETAADINDVSERVAQSIAEFLTESVLSKKLSEIVTYRDSLDGLHRRNIIKQLTKLEATARKFREKLEADSIRRVK